MLALFRPITILSGLFVLIAMGCAGSAHRTLEYTSSPIRAVHGMTLGHDGRLLLADTYKYYDPERSAIYALGTDGELASVFSGIELAGVSKTKNGYLICDFGANKVFLTTKSFDILNEWMIEQPWNAQEGADGARYVVTYSSFMRLLDDGVSQVEIASLNYPFDFAFDPAGRGVWISEQDQGEAGAVDLWTFNSPDGGWRRLVVSQYNWSNPEGVIFIGEELYVAETALGEIVSVGPEGSAERLIDGLELPILIERKQDGDLVVFANGGNSAPSLIEFTP